MRAKQMLATMSHEIRSPLSGVISMASILARTPLNEDQKLKVDFMIQSGNDVLELINDILDLSKVEAGMALTFFSVSFAMHFRFSISLLTDIGEHPCSLEI